MLADDLAADRLLDHTPAEEPIPYQVVAPSWVSVSQAEEYDDYDAAIPFHVVDAYTADRAGGDIPWDATAADVTIPAWAGSTTASTAGGYQGGDLGADAAWDAAGYVSPDVHDDTVAGTHDSAQYDAPLGGQVDAADAWADER